MSSAMAILVFIRSNLYLMVLSMIIIMVMMMMMTVSSMNIVDLGLTTVT